MSTEESGLASLFNIPSKVDGAPAFLSEDRNVSWNCLTAGGFSVFAGVGERTREGNDLYKEMIESVSSRLVLLPLT